MKKGFWKRLFQSSPKKTFSAWQIELTSRCPLRCLMCPRQECSASPPPDMRLEDFKRLLPYLSEVEAVVLEGWGESLLHPHLIEAVRLAKKEGPRVGFVTSGMGLNEAYIDELVQAQVDFMGFSLSGATPQTHDAIRVHSKLEALIRNIRILQEKKAQLESDLPQLHLVYLLLKDNIRETPKLIQLAGELKIPQVILIHLTHVANAWQNEQRVFGTSHSDDWEKILQETGALAKQKKISLSRPSLSFRDAPLCSENPLRNLYISTEGDVSPCVYLNPPLPSPFKRIFRDREVSQEKVQWGNLLRSPLSSVWDSPSYQGFRQRWASRVKRFEEMSSLLLNPDNGKRKDSSPLPDAPEPCQTCHKVLGI